MCPRPRIYQEPVLTIAIPATAEGVDGAHVRPELFSRATFSF